MMRRFSLLYIILLLQVSFIGLWIIQLRSEVYELKVMLELVQHNQSEMKTKQRILELENIARSRMIESLRKEQP